MAAMAAAHKSGEQMENDQYPHGKISKDDEGVINIAITADRGCNVIRIHFGKDIRWIAFDVESAERFTHVVEQKIDELKAGRLKIYEPDSDLEN